MVKFLYDPEKCELPYDDNLKRPSKCLKCLEICPYSLIMFRPMKEVAKDGSPLRYEIYMTFKSKGDNYCPDCQKCVEICPNKAIEIKI
jgi:ferredoxin